MLNLVCRYPQSNDRPVWEPFCKEAGQPCPLGSWYAHNIAQWGLREKHLGLVSIPLALVDPVGSCPASAHMLQGGQQHVGVGLEMALELARGAFLIKKKRGFSDAIKQLLEKAHRRAISAVLPESGVSGGGKKDHHDGNSKRASALVPVGAARSADHTNAYAAAKQRLSPTFGVVFEDPLWVPGGFESRLVLRGPKGVRDGKGEVLCLMFGNGGRPTFSKPCNAVVHDKDEKGVWIMHSRSKPQQAKNSQGVRVGSGAVEGVIMPAFKGASDLLCLDGGAGGNTNNHNTDVVAVQLARCSKTAESQQWLISNINGKTRISPRHTARRTAAAGSVGGRTTASASATASASCLKGGEIDVNARANSACNAAGAVGTNKCPIPLVLAFCGNGPPLQHDDVPPEAEYQWDAFHPMFIGGGGLRPTLDFELAMQPNQ